MTDTWIYDTPALAGYAMGRRPHVRLGLRLIAEDPEFRLTVPVVCLLEAYPATPPDFHYLLDSLAINPGVVIDGVGADSREVIQAGRLAGRLGRAGAAQAARTALRGGENSVVFTDIEMPPEVETQPV